MSPAAAGCAVPAARTTVPGLKIPLRQISPLYMGPAPRRSSLVCLDGRPPGGAPRPSLPAPKFIHAPVNIDDREELIFRIACSDAVRYLLFAEYRLSGSPSVTFTPGRVTGVGGLSGKREKRPGSPDAFRV